jgi:hypothetical protein
VASTGADPATTSGRAGRPELNLLVFEHACGSSVSVRVTKLYHILGTDSLDGRQYLLGTEFCDEHCRFIEDLMGCDQPCVNARDRDLIQAVMRVKAQGLGAL